MKNQNSREIILDSALKLFSGKGYDGISINEITEAAGITKPTLYYFFGSKEGLFKEILKLNYSLLNDSLYKASSYAPNVNDYDKDVYFVLTNIVKSYFGFAAKNKDFYLMALSFMTAPETSEAFKLAEEYHKIQYVVLEKTFFDISAVHGNVKGKEKIYSWRFLAVINAHIGFWNRGYVYLNDDEAQALVKQFMHGIFS